MGWKQGPLPPGTWNWGGVVPRGEEPSGFYFADFCGDHVVVQDGGGPGTPIPHRVLKPEDVAWYNNSLDLPPSGKGRNASGGK